MHFVIRCVYIFCEQKDHDSVKLENGRLETQISSLRQDLDVLRQAKANGSPQSPEKKPSYGELKLELIQTRQELNRAIELLQGKQ